MVVYRQKWRNSSLPDTPDGEPNSKYVYRYVHCHIMMLLLCGGLRNPVTLSKKIICVQEMERNTIYNTVYCIKIFTL